MRTTWSLLLLLVATGTATVGLAQSGTGTVERIQVFGQSLSGNLRGETDWPEVSVYLPPSYATEANRRYPVIYVLHGYSGTDLNWFGERPTWDGAGAANRTMGPGSVNDMIIVMPNCMNAFGGCMYANSAATGYWEDYIADDLVAWVDSHYRTIADRSARGLAGHSMGGYGVWLIGMHRPDVFSALYSLSACCLNEYAPRGGESNYGEHKLSRIYFSGTLDAAIWGCELARGDGQERIYIVEPTGAFFDDPNLTDKRFPGNPTKSYRSREPLRIVGEIEQWEGHPPARLREMKDHLARMEAEGRAEIID